MNNAFVSSLSLAEIEIKRSIGKLEITEDFRQAIEISGLQELAYTCNDSRNLHQLPFHHKDPFDRMLICQAMARNMPLLTADEIFSKYPLKAIIN